MRRFRLGIMLLGLSLLALAAHPAAQSGNGSLKVTSFPSGARVAIDGTDTGKTTPMSISLSAGDHVVAVSIPGSGWAPDQRTVTIVEGNNDLSVTLLPRLTTGPAGPKGDTGDKGDPGAPGAPGAVTQAQFDALDARVTALEGLFSVTPPPTPIPPIQTGNDFSCMATPAPTTAADTVAVTGTALRLVGFPQNTPASGVLAEFHRRSDGAVLATSWTDDSGRFTLTVTTGGVPLDGYVNLSSPDLAPTRVYASRMLVADAALPPLILVPPDSIQALYLLARSPWMSGESTLIAMTRDCNGEPVPNATVSAVPARFAPVYLWLDGFPALNLTATSNYAMAWLLNQPVADTAIQARLNGNAFAQTIARTLAGGITYVILIP